MSLSGQVVITAGQYPSAVNDSFVSFSNSAAATVSYNPADSVWDFSSGPQTDTTLLVMIAVSRTPHASMFPTAEFAAKQYSVSDTHATYTYSRKNTDSMFAYGASVWSSDSGRYLGRKFYPSLKLAPFPLQTGVTWTAIDSIALGQVLGMRAVMYDTVRGKVIRQGTVMTPDLGAQPCLLVRHSIRGFARLRPLGIVIDTAWQEVAEWVVPGTGAVVSITSAAGDTSWPITHAAPDGFNRLWTHMIAGIAANVPEGAFSPTIKMGPAFPNPSSGPVSIPYRLPTGGYQTCGRPRLGIYDITGRLVRSLAAQRLPAGWDGFYWDTKDGDGNPAAAGVYLYRFISGANASTGKLTILR